MKTLEERFLLKIHKTKDCWLWVGAKMGSGYGVMRDSDQSMQGAHRISYKLYKGDIPKDKIICHTCDNKSCVNPDHLFLGTQSDNMQDMHKKGRANFGGRNQTGKNNNAVKVTEDQVITIKKLHKQKIKQADIAKITGVSRPNVWCIVHGKSWNHIP